MADKPNVAIVGITGAVGQEMATCLEERDFPIGKLTPLASARSAGKTIHFRGQDISVAELSLDSFTDIDIALFEVGFGMAI